MDTRWSRCGRWLLLSVLVLVWLGACRSAATVTPTASVPTSMPAVTPAATPAADQALLSSQALAVLHRIGGVSTTLTAGDTRPVHAGDVIDVDSQGEGLLRFRDYLLIRIFRDSHLGTLTLEGSVDPQAPPIYRYRLEAGATYNTSTAQGEAQRRVSVLTKWAVIEDVGTSFLAYYDQRTETTWVVVESGSVRVSAPNADGNNVVSVDAGMQTWVEPNQAPVPPVPATRAAVGNRFPLIDRLTNDALHDNVLLAATAPSATLSPTLVPSAVSRQCTITVASGDFLNLRTGPAAQFPVVEQMQPNTLFAPRGRLGDGSWIVGATATHRGWAASRFMRCAFDLFDLPIVDVPTPPTATPTRTSTTTASAAPTNTPTATSTPIFTPTVTATPTTFILGDGTGPHVVTPTPVAPQIKASVSPNPVFYGDTCGKEPMRLMVQAAVRDPSRIVATVVFQYRYVLNGAPASDILKQPLQARRSIYTLSGSIGDEAQQFLNGAAGVIEYQIQARDANNYLVAETAFDRVEVQACQVQASPIIR